MNRREHSRREFLSRTGLGVVGVASGQWMLGTSARGQNADNNAQNADRIVVNATVYTVDSRAPKVEAFAIKRGRIVAVGSNAEIKALAGKATETFDGKGMTIVPGFIDCHNHGGGEGLLYNTLVGNPYEVEFVSIQSIIEKLRARGQATPPDTWIDGYFHDDTKLKDKRPLNTHDLDQVSTARPVCVHHRGGHTSFYNSKAFELAGITKNTPNPYGGTYDKDANGELNGRVTDRARESIERFGAREKFTAAQRKQRVLDGVAFMSKKFAQYGLTTVHHNEVGVLAAMQEQRANGRLVHRVSYETSGPLLEAMIANGIESNFGDDWIRLGATSEHTADGSLSERTMAISQPYIGISPPYYGNLTETQEDLDVWVEKVHRAGIRVNCHANGDVAIDRVLTAYERANQLFPRADTRPKITHCSLINPSLIQRIQALNVVPAMFSTYPYYNADKFDFYGPEMMTHMMAFRTMLDAKIVAAAGSDFSPGPFSPLMAIQAMVTRTGWNGKTWGANQKITVDEAIRVNTINGAYNSREEASKGSITPGKLADFIVLAEDPHTVDPEKIKDIRIVQTVVDGKVVYESR